MGKSRWQGLIGWMCCGILLLLTVTAAARTMDEDLAAGRRLLGELRFEEAYTRLFAAFERRPDDPEINFLLGRAAFEKGDYEAAIMAFDRVLIVHPEAMRVKLELARCYYRLASYATARHYLQEVLDAGPPEAVKSNILVMLDRIQERERRHFLHGSLVLGLSHDDNARTAPNDDRVSMVVPFFGLARVPITDKPGDNVYGLTLVLSHLYRPLQEGMLWKSSFFHYTGDYQFEDDLDTDYTGVATGPSWQMSSAASFDLQPFVNLLALGRERYLRTAGVEGVYSRMLGTNVLLQLGGKVADKYYFQDTNRNRDAVTTTFSFNELLQFGALRLTLGVTAELEEAKAAWYTYDRYGIDLRVERDFPCQVNVWLSGHRHGAKYEAADPAFGLRRIDKVWGFGAGMRKTLWAERQRRFDIELSLSRTNANSSIALYTYDKDVVNANLVLSF